MNLTNNTILITGGATGIGLELAKQFLQRGNTVIVCGRRADKLDEARQLLPQLITQQCDLSDAEQRRSLFRFCISEYPTLNVLINNAGIQREIDFRQGEQHYLDGASETAINIEAVFHLAALFTPHLMQQTSAAIINVSSGAAGYCSGLFCHKSGDAFLFYFITQAIKKYYCKSIRTVATDC
jgi:uncharacterized oxidoreductase